MSKQIQIPAELAEVIATHRALFGGFVMQEGEGGQSTYAPPATQADFDRMIADRLGRQEQKLRGEYADYDDMKAKAGKFDQADAASKSELQKATDRAEAAEKKATDYEAEKTAAAEKVTRDAQVKTWADEVAKAAKIPASALRGSTKEELQAHADELKALIKPNKGAVGPYVPSEGSGQDGQPVAPTPGLGTLRAAYAETTPKL